MKAFVIVTGTITDPEKFAAYAKGASKSMKEYGVKPVGRGRFQGMLAGTGEPHAMSVVLEFESAEAIDHWYQSESYQAVLPLREEAADLKFYKYLAF